MTDTEQNRLQEAHEHSQPWYRWGPYLSERHWATVREDYSADGNAWAFFPHDHARSSTYRWGEDGLLGISRIASSESDPMVALTSETRRSMLNALPRKLAGVMFYRLLHLQGCPPDGGHGNGSQPSRSWLEPLKSLGMQSRKQGQYASGPFKTGLGEGRLQEVPHPQHVGPVTQIGQIKRGSLPAYDAQDVIPLACRGTSAHLKPLELREDRILRRCDAHRARASL